MILPILISFLSCKKEESTPLPQANFYAEVKSCTNDTCVVYFFDNSVNAVYWNWDFGNGKQSTKPNDSAIYSNLGNYIVTLKVSNLDAVEDTKVKSIQF